VFLFPQNSICILLSVNFVSSAEVVVIFQLGFVVIAIEKGGGFYGKMVAFFVAEKTLSIWILQREIVLEGCVYDRR